MFASKAFNFPKRGETERYSTWVDTWPYPQTLNLVENACQGQALSLVGKLFS